MHNKKNKYKYTMEELRNKCIRSLKDRNVDIKDIAQIVYDLQKKYYDSLSLDMCEDSIIRVLSKREVTHAVLTAIEIDKAVENGVFDEPIRSIIGSDQGLYGIDEILPLSIVNIYGTIGLTNFGYLDKAKHGIIKRLDTAIDGSCNTFLDDIVAALAAAAASRLAHNRVE